MGATYVYGVVDAGAEPALFRAESGLEGRSVSLVVYGSVAALVSPLAGARARGTRANLSAHQRVVEAACRAGTILPVRFGTVMPDDEAVVKEFLEPYAPQLEGALRDLTGRHEFRVRATYLPDVTIREALSSDPRLRRVRHVLAARGGGSYHERIELGERVAEGVSRIKAADGDAVIGRLHGLGVPVLALDDQGPDVAVHATVLVDDSERIRLEATVEQLAREDADRLRFELVGPLAPWDFVDLQPTDRRPAGRGRARVDA